MTSLVSAQADESLKTESREQLLARITAAQADYSETQRLYKSAGGAFRLRNMQTRIQEQLRAWHQLEKLSDATSSQQHEAIAAQVTLLSQGAESEWNGYVTQLLALRDRLLAERPGSLEAGHADAAIVWHTQLRKLGDSVETLAALEQHAATYPTSPTGPALYARYALLLVEAHQLPEATRVCELAAQRCQDNKLLQPVRDVMTQIQGIRVAEEKRLSMLAARAREFGGHYDGYFVLFLRPKKLAHLAEVDYVVAHGLEDAIHSADSAEACQMKGWFPDSPGGAEHANALADRLLRDNTIEIMTYE